MIERQTLETDIVCVGFGPAVGGFLTTLTRGLVRADGSPAVESRVAPGSPLQVLCYERADDMGFGVSGVVTRARGIRATFPDLDLSQIPLSAPVTGEKVLYLLDPVGASRRSAPHRLVDKLVRAFGGILGVKDDAYELPYIPPFLHKAGGFVASIGQFNSWVGAQLMGSGLVQVWPGSPVAKPLIEGDRVVGVRLIDQGVAKTGEPDANYMPGMDVKAALTVVGDGPVGPVGRALDRHFGMPKDHHAMEWAVGMKVVIDLPEGCDLKPGTVLHTMGFPEPEIFGFLYVYEGRVATAGIFVPSWFASPARTSYRYLQHWLQHPAIWKHVSGGSIRSWGAKSLQESGRRGEPFLVGEGYARIGEGSGSTNVLTGSGVDEAWTTGTQLAEAVLELAKAGKPYTKQSLTDTYVSRRRLSWVEREGRVAEKARNGFQKGFLWGSFGMGLSGLTGGLLNLPGKELPPAKQMKSLEDFYRHSLSAEGVEQLKRDCLARGAGLHDALMDQAGWPRPALDGRMLISHQDALLLGGKVQAPPGYADHVKILQPNLCEACGVKVCVEMCSGQALTLPERVGPPQFDREKCVHCGACLWNCSELLDPVSGGGNLDFQAGPGGFHSAEN